VRTEAVAAAAAAAAADLETMHMVAVEKAYNTVL